MSSLTQPLKCDSCGNIKMVAGDINGSFCLELFWSYENSECGKCGKNTMNPVEDGSIPVEA